ncbi:MAG TPA: efflux transporter outer membrane subunit [Planctomycetota bacterium]
MRWPALLLLVLAACASTRLQVPMSTGVETPSSFGTATPAGSVQADWWKTFGDPKLDELVLAGLEHNQDLLAAVARLDAAAVQADIADAALLPTLDAGFDAARRRQNFPGLPLPGGGDSAHTTFSSYGVDLTSSWELDLWGRVRASTSAAVADFEATAAEVHGVRVSLAAQIARAWFSLVEATLQEDLALRSVGSWTDTAEAVRRRFESGVRPAFDVHLVDSSLYAAQAVHAGRIEQRQRAVRQLELLLGRYPDGTLVAGANLPGVGGPPPAGLPAELLRRRPDVVAAERRATAQDHRVAEAVAALYPRLVLTASGGTQSEDLENVLDPDFLVWSLLGNLTAPLFRGGALRGEVALQEAFLRQVCAEYAAVAQRAFAEVETALVVEAVLAEREQQVDRAAVAANAAAADATSRYGRGLEGIITLLEAQRRAQEADSQLLAAKLARIDARITLFAALGGGFLAGADTPESIER